MRYSARFVRGAQAEERIHIGVESRSYFLGERLDGDAPLFRGGINFIVNVGDVAHIGYTFFTVYMAQ